VLSLTSAGGRARSLDGGSSGPGLVASTFGRIDIHAAAMDANSGAVGRRGRGVMRAGSGESFRDEILPPRGPRTRSKAFDRLAEDAVPIDAGEKVAGAVHIRS
jgi:hypothetical protein